MGTQRERGQNIMFWVTKEERELIQRKMELAGVRNMSAYLRKMAIDGYVVRLDLPELRDLASNVRRSGANLNQLARRVELNHALSLDKTPAPEQKRKNHEEVR